MELKSVPKKVVDFVKKSSWASQLQIKPVVQQTVKMSTEFAKKPFTKPHFVTFDSVYEGKTEAIFVFIPNKGIVGTRGRGITQIEVKASEIKDKIIEWHLLEGSIVKAMVKFGQQLPGAEPNSSMKEESYENSDTYGTWS